MDKITNANKEKKSSKESNNTTDTDWDKAIDDFIQEALRWVDCMGEPKKKEKKKPQTRTAEKRCEKGESSIFDEAQTKTTSEFVTQTKKGRVPKERAQTKAVPKQSKASKPVEKKPKKKSRKQKQRKRPEAILVGLVSEGTSYAHILRGLKTDQTLQEFGATIWEPTQLSVLQTPPSTTVSSEQSSEVNRATALPNLSLVPENQLRNKAPPKRR
uniref:Uncharacterized protein n=1 Tax=Anopheles maculatus TaxID=74869 RepID=A0A182SC03_9DIPT